MKSTNREKTTTNGSIRFKLFEIARKFQNTERVSKCCDEKRRLDDTGNAEQVIFTHEKQIVTLDILDV